MIRTYFRNEQHLMEYIESLPEEIRNADYNGIVFTFPTSESLEASEDPPPCPNSP